MKISIVSPVYQAENIIAELVKRVSVELKELTDDFEIILVNDNSPDNSWSIIKEQCVQFSYVYGIKLSRNFGQHNAISAGVNFASGDVIILMDCDLQDDPQHIQLLIEEYNNGNEIVFTKRVNRKHNFFKYFTAKLYNMLFHLVADRSFDLNVGSLVLFSKKVQTEFLKLKESDKLYIQALKWLGFQHTYIYVEHRSRFEGKSSYKYKDLVQLAIQGWISNSEKLLYLSIKIGILFTFIALIAITLIIYNYFIQSFQPGWPSLISTILLSTGLILTSLGVLGIYIGKILNEVRNRPQYVIEDVLNIK